MDDQPRRRRRPQTEQPPAAPETEKKPSVASSDGAPQRRRRKAAAQPAHEGETDELFWHPESEALDAQPPVDAKGKKTPRPLGFIAAIDGFICRIGDGILYLIKWLSVGLLYLLGFIASGGKKGLGRLRARRPKTANRKSVHTGRRVPRKTAQAQPPQSVTIEPTRPDDYHGMGEKRASSGKKQPIGSPKQKRTVRAPGRNFSPAYSAAMAALVCVALVSAYMIGSILWRSISTKRLSDSLSQRYSELSETAAQEEGSDAGETAAQAISPSAENSSAAQLPEESPAQDEPEPTAAPAGTQAPAKKDAVLSTKFHQLGGDALPEMEALYKDNHDLVGWLRMEGILDLPVVYRDNEYYLTRDFYKNKSASGTLFLDENHPFRENAQNLLLHGHNMKDGTMFGRLVQYETNLQFLKNNPFIQYSTLWQKEQYVICAVLHVSLDIHSDQFFNYFTHHTFSSDTQFESYVRLLQNRSVFSIPVDIEPTDALLTLSTCLDEDRLVIVARRVRPGESKSELRRQVQLAARQ